jgi:tetratricopeptide (TPR) repeat protein
MATLEPRQTGDTDNFAHLTHIVPSPNPLAQIQSWRAYLFQDNFEAALEDVDDWPARFLDSKDYRLTKTFLKGLTLLYSGDVEGARPLLLEAKQEFEAWHRQDESDYPVTRSLCYITAGLGDLEGARRHCKQALELAPADRYLEGNFKYNAATGLALAGDAEASIAILRSMLDGDAGPNMYDVIYHPAYDGIRDTEAYLQLLDEYGPDNTPR